MTSSFKCLLTVVPGLRLNRRRRKFEPTPLASQRTPPYIYVVSTPSIVGPHGALPGYTPRTSFRVRSLLKLREEADPFSMDIGVLGQGDIVKVLEVSNRSTGTIAL